MTPRWRALLGPEGAAPAPVPRAREVLCAWALGLFWMLGCLWLAGASRPAALPILLLAGVLVVWGWAYMTWIAWFPGVLLIAAVAQPFVPFEFRLGSELVGITGTMAIAVLVIGIVRAIAFHRRLFPRTPIDGPLLALFALVVLSAIPATIRPAALHQIKLMFVGAVTFYACTVVASLPGGTLRLWPIYPLALAAITVAAALQSLGVITSQGAELGRAAMLQSILIALPPAAGLALDAGRRSPRIVWRVTAFVGVAACCALAFQGFGPRDLDSPFRLGAPLGFARAVVVWTILFGLAALALKARQGRPLERARWIGLAAALIGSAALELIGRPIDSLTQVVLLATGAGLTAGTARAAARRAVIAAEASVLERSAVAAADDLEREAA